MDIGYARVFDAGPTPGATTGRPARRGLSEGICRAGLRRPARAPAAAGRPRLRPAGRHPGGLEARSPGALTDAAHRDDRASGHADIGFRSLTQAIETTTAGGRLVFHIFASLAEFERAIIRERTRAGLDAARARGRTGGRPPARRRARSPPPRRCWRILRSRSRTWRASCAWHPSTLYRHLPGGRECAARRAGLRQRYRTWGTQAGGHGCA